MIVHMSVGAMAAIVHGSVMGSGVKNNHVIAVCGLPPERIFGASVSGLCGQEHDGSGQFRYNDGRFYFPLVKNKTQMLVCSFNINQQTMLIDQGIVITCPQCIKQIKKFGY